MNFFEELIRTQNLSFLTPEVLVLLGLTACIFMSFAKNPEEQKMTWWFSFLSVLCAMACLIIHGYYAYWVPITQHAAPAQSELVFFNMFQQDLFSTLIRIFLTSGTLLTLLISKQYVDNGFKQVPGEFYILMLGALFGGMLMAGAIDLIMLFVGLETLGISSYLMVGYLRGNSQSAEASLKYLLYGGACTAVLLFGFTMLYGFSGGYTDFASLAMALRNTVLMQGYFSLIVPVLAVLILGGFAFKISAAPFHMWAPDVYEGAPTPVTAFLSVVSKTAAFAVALRFFAMLFAGIQAWFHLLGVLAVLSMFIGNVVALRQTNIKRLLAYSTIAHVGYMLLGAVTMSQEGMGTIVYYLFTYLFMNIGAFGCVIYFSNLTGSDTIADYSGMVQKRPVLALTLSLFLLSLAGIPITAGFFAKFFLFQTVASFGHGSPEYLWLVIIALLNSTISLYYYLNIIRLMVVAEPSTAVSKLSDEAQRVNFSALNIGVTVCLLGTMLLGIWADPFVHSMTISINQMVTPPQQQVSLLGQSAP